MNQIQRMLEGKLSTQEEAQVHAVEQQAKAIAMRAPRHVEPRMYMCSIESACTSQSARAEAIKRCSAWVDIVR